MAECPTCQDTFDTQRGVKQHHSIAHNESIAKAELTCQYCGKEYRKYQSLVDQSEKNFCSQECNGKWIEEHQEPEEAPRWNGGKITTECDWCGDEIQKPRYRIENTENNFCDDQCKGEWFAENQVGEDHHQFQQIKVECDCCGNEIYRQPHEINSRDKLFCGQECRGQWLSNNRVGEDSPLWKGGPIFYYGEDWYSQRRKAIDRDDEQCQDCGMTRDQHYDEHGTDLEVHHKTPIRTFEDTIDANKLSNLITLCTTCHMKRENN